MRISDWSSDVCSSDLAERGERLATAQRRGQSIGHVVAPLAALVSVETDFAGRGAGVNAFPGSDAEDGRFGILLSPLQGRDTQACELARQPELRGGGYVPLSPTPSDRKSVG